MLQAAMLDCVLFDLFPLSQYSFVAAEVDVGWCNVSYCQIWCLRVFRHAATWPFGVVSIPSLNATPVMTLAR